MLNVESTRVVVDVAIVVLVPAVGFWIKSVLSKRDRLQSDKDVLNERLRLNSFNELKNTITTQTTELSRRLIEYCEKNTSQHREIWGRVNSHRHVVECDSKECGKVKTGEVIISHDEVM